MRLHRMSVVFSATSFGAHLMHPVFAFFYVKVYTQRFHVTQPWFQAAQVVFMIWNAINDPLFGYIQDNYNCSLVRSRRHSILYGAPWFVLSFLILWFPWGDYYGGTAPDWLCGMQLMIGLCLYDTVFTFSLLAHCALFTELSTEQTARIRLVRYSQVASLLGCGSVYVVNMASNNLVDYSMFLVVCTVLAIVAGFSMVYTGLYADTQFDMASVDHTTGKSHPPMERQVSEYGIVQQTMQIVRQQDFLAFVLVNFFQVLHGTFLANFGGVICDKLVSSEYLSVGQRSVFYGSLFLLPQCVTILISPLVERVGYFRLFRVSFVLKICLGLALFLTGPRPYAIVLFFLLLGLVTRSVSALLNLVVSDIIDKDKELYNRRHPMSSMVYGTNALITKPAISFAPMLTVSILNMAGYQNVTAHGATSHNVTSLSSDLELRQVMFALAYATPILIGAFQLVIWSRYTIRNSHEMIPKHLEA